jgi:hypothetical protein
MNKFSAILEDNVNVCFVQYSRIINLNIIDTFVIEENSDYLKALTINEIIKSQNIDREKINEVIITLFKTLASKINAKYAACNDLDYQCLRIAAANGCNIFRELHDFYYSSTTIEKVEIIVMDVQHTYFIKNKDKFLKDVK